MELKVNLPKFISKLLLLLLLSLFGGAWLNNSGLEDNRKAQKLTLQEYTAGFDTYKKGLSDEPSSIPLASALVFFVLGVTFGLYEILAFVLSAVFTSMLKKPANF